MAEPFLSEIRLFSFDFAPRGWAQCNGSLLPINQNQALFSLLGTTYGGNGTTNFALPDLRGRGPIHIGNGHVEGQSGGEVNHTLSIAETPSHNHPVTASSVTADLVPPTANFFASGGQAAYNAPPDTTLDPSVLPASGGGNQGHSNLPPYAVTNMCIALTGIFPSRN